MIKHSGLLAAFLTLFLSASLRAEEVSGTPQYQPIAPALSHALHAIDADAVVGVFLFVNPNDGPVALANYLVRDHQALKKYVKSLEKDVKSAQAVSRWDKLVCLHMVALGVDRSVSAKGKVLSKKWAARVQNLTLTPSLNYSEILMRRGGR